MNQAAIDTSAQLRDELAANDSAAADEEAPISDSAPVAPTLFLVDLGAIYWQAWHSSNRDQAPDEPAQAALSRVRRWATEYAHVAICVDDPTGNWRHDLFAAYKATRTEKPEGATAQLRRSIEILRREGFPIWGAPHQEADDVLASATDRAIEAGYQVVLATADKDLMQVVRPGVRVLNTKTGVMMGEAEVLAKYEVRPDQIHDYLTLVGDTSDNVPGVPGVGAKGAALLLGKYGNLAGVREAAHNETSELKPKVRESIKNSTDAISLAWSLIRLERGLPIPIEEAFRSRSGPETEADDLLDEIAPPSDPIAPQVPVQPSEPEPVRKTPMATQTPAQHTNGAVNGAAPPTTQAPALAAPKSRFTVARGAVKLPHATILTGQSGIGKTFFASTIPTAFFICVEQGLKGASMDHVQNLARFDETPRSLKDLAEMIDAFLGLAKEAGHRHLVIDSLSGIERLVNLAACNQESVAHMDAKAYKTVWTSAIAFWTKLQRSLDKVREAGIHVWLIAHSSTATETIAETGDTYTKFDLAFQGSGNSLVALRQLWRGWADHVLFIDWDASVKQGKSLSQKAVGKYNARVLRTRESPAHYAKNRANLPPTLPATWQDLERAMRAGAPATDAKLKAQIEAILPKVSDENGDRESVRAEMAAAKTATQLAAILSRAQGLISAAREDEPEVEQDQAVNETNEGATNE